MNPFRSGTTQYQDFETMSDLKWHCTKCELKSGQAKTWQVWRQEKGIQLAQDEEGHWFKKMECPHCRQLTIHRKLLSTEIVVNDLKARSTIPPEIARRAKSIYGCVDEYSVRTEPANQLEIDHRIPQVRWDGDESDNRDLTDAQIREKFMLLSRANNLLKSRICEECKRTGKRGKGYKIVEFWYEGSESYEASVGCCGCFWHNPTKWREEINKAIKRMLGRA